MNKNPATNKGSENIMNNEVERCVPKLIVNTSPQRTNSNPPSIRCRQATNRKTMVTAVGIKCNRNSPSFCQIVPPPLKASKAKTVINNANPTTTIRGNQVRKFFIPICFDKSRMLDQVLLLFHTQSVPRRRCSSSIDSNRA